MNSSGLQLTEKRMLTLMETISNGQIINITAFLNSIGIYRSTFFTQLKKIEKKYPELYEEYENKCQNNKKLFDDRCKNLIITIEDMLINGIKTDDENVRKFDILDWYYIRARYFENCPRKYIMNILDEMDRDLKTNEHRIVHARSLISSSFNCHFGNFDRKITPEHIINDVFYNLSDEEKNEIIMFFSQNRIPYTLTSFDCAANRIKNSDKNKSLNRTYNCCFKINNQIR